MMRCWMVLSMLGLAFGAATVAADDGSGSYAGEVTASRLNLRAGPGPAYQTVARLEQGAKVVVHGPAAHDPNWLRVEVPQGYHAWVYGRFLAKQPDGRGRVTTDRLLVRPRPTTRYHELDGRLAKDELVEIVDEREGEEGHWYKIAVPRRIALFATAEYLRNIGAPELAEPDEKEAAPAAAPDAPVKRAATDADVRFAALEKNARVQLAASNTTGEIGKVKKSILEFETKGLSLDNRERRVRLLTEIADKERAAAILELKERSRRVKVDLEAQLEEIQKNYERRLREIREEYEKKKSPRFVATGILRWKPDILGRYPAYRIEEGGKMRYFVIATDYDLGRFRGKRVGLVGLTDPESGTGYETVIARRIEILGDE